MALGRRRRLVQGGTMLVMPNRSLFLLLEYFANIFVFILFHCCVTEKESGIQANTEAGKFVSQHVPRGLPFSLV